jgi:hypothetical protein
MRFARLYERAAEFEGGPPRLMRRRPDVEFEDKSLSSYRSPRPASQTAPASRAIDATIAKLVLANDARERTVNDLRRSLAALEMKAAAGALAVVDERARWTAASRARSAWLYAAHGGF